MASFVHSLRHHGTDLKYCKRISQTETTETTDLFFPATCWKWHSSKLQNCLLCLSSFRRSRDVTTDICALKIFWILFFYLFVLFIYLSYIFILHIYLLFSAVRHPPSAIRHPPSAIRHPPSAVRFLILQTPLRIFGLLQCYILHNCYT